MKLMFCMLINMKVFLQGDGIIFDGFGQVCPKTQVNLQYLRDKSRMKLGT